MNKSQRQFDLVMISMSSVSEWQRGVVNRNRLILRNLKRRPEINKVFVVDFLPFTAKRALRNWVQNILFGIKGKIIKTRLFDRCVEYDGIYVYSTIESFWSADAVIKKINKLIKKLGFENILLWSYQPMFVNYFGRLNEFISVFDAVDNWYENVHYRPYKLRLKENYTYIAKNVDVIFTVAEDLVHFFKDLGRTRNLYWIPNGIEYEDFENPPATPAYLKKFFYKLRPPIIGYIGTIQNRLDFELIDYIAKMRPNWNIVLAGPTWPVYFKRFRPIPTQLKEIKKNINVYFTGRIPYQYMPYVIGQFDVGIIPHKIDSFVKSMNPMKMYDYLAAGKPIVSTPGAGVELFNDLISIAHNKNEFVLHIEQALKNDSSLLRAKRKARVKNHSYKNRVRQMFNYLYESY